MDTADIVQSLHPIRGSKALHTTLLSDALQLTPGELIHIDYKEIRTEECDDEVFLIMHTPACDTDAGSGKSSA